MGSANARHPGSDDVRGRWAVQVPLLPDELFSSWLVRTALAQGCDPLVLTGALWPRWRIWTRDPDRGLNEERIAILARISGIEASRFEAATLRPTAAAIAQAPLDRLGIWPWMLALGSRNRMHRGGLQCCPCCLRENGVPYYRTQWRLAWHTGCGAHGVFLLDRCPRCNAPLEPHRLSAQACHLAICATCQQDLRNAHTVPFPSAAHTFQRTADEILKAGQGFYGTKRLFPGGFLELSRYFVMLLRKMALTRAQRLVSFAQALGVDADSLWLPATGLALELLPVGERAQLVAGAWKMLNAGPECFLAAAKDAALTKASLEAQHRCIPDLIARLIGALPEKNVPRKQATRSARHRPRSRQTVMGMFVRLQRKMLVGAR